MNLSSSGFQVISDLHYIMFKKVIHKFMLSNKTVTLYADNTNNNFNSCKRINKNNA